MQDVDESEESGSEEDFLDALYKWSSHRSKRNLQSLKFLSFKAIAANAKWNSLSIPEALLLPLHILCTNKFHITTEFHHSKFFLICLQLRL